MIYILIGIFLFLVVFIVLFGIISIKFEIGFKNSKIDFKVYIYNIDITKFILKGKKKKRKGELVKTKSEKRGMDVKISSRIFIKIMNKIKYLRSKPRFIINGDINYGLDEADVTAILYGYISTAIYSITGILGTYLDIEGSNININPKYNAFFFEMHFVGILRVKIVQIIYISFLFITLRREPNGATSNRKFNENYS